MYKLPNGRYSHGCYIRPGEYTDMWRQIKSNARMLDISVSEYVSHYMHISMYGKEAKQSKLMQKKRKMR